MSKTEIMKLENKLRAPEKEVGLVPGVHYTLLIGVNFIYADYDEILDK